MFEAITQQYSLNPQAGPVQLICTGALSNAAMLLLLYPEVKPLIEITIMGGAMGVSAAGSHGGMKGSSVVEGSWVYMLAVGVGVVMIWCCSAHGGG
jgi:hypothetical protein